MAQLSSVVCHFICICCLTVVYFLCWHKNVVSCCCETEGKFKEDSCARTGALMHTETETEAHMLTLVMHTCI